MQTFIKETSLGLINKRRLIMKFTYLLTVVAAVLLLVGCSGNNNTPDLSKPYIGGKVGLKMTYSEGMPPEKVFDNSQLPFGIQLQLENYGESSVAAGDAYIEILA
jgi:hypothetical protein